MLVLVLQVVFLDESSDLLLQSLMRWMSLTPIKGESLHQVVKGIVILFQHEGKLAQAAQSSRLLAGGM